MIGFKLTRPGATIPVEQTVSPEFPLPVNGTVNVEGKVLVEEQNLSAGEDLAGNRVRVAPQCLVMSLSAAGTLVRTGPGLVLGYIVVAGGGGTVKLWDNIAGSGTPVLLDTFTVVENTEHPFPGAARFNTGLYVTLGDGAKISLFYMEA